MVASDSFAEFLREQLAPPRPRHSAPHVRQDRRVLRWGDVWDGNNMLYLRVDDHNREAFKEAELFPPPQLREEGLHHRPLLLACAGAAVRRTRRVGRVGVGSTGGGASGRGEGPTDGAEAKIEVATRRVVGLSRITVDI